MNSGDNAENKTSLACLRKQPKLRDATIGFLAKCRLRNEQEMTCHYPGLRSVSDWLWRKNILLQLIRSTTQIWVMTGHQYIISALVAHTSFRRKPVMVSQKVGCSLRRKQTKPFAFVGGWKNDKTVDSFHGFSSSAASVSLGLSLLFVYANNPNKIFMKHNKLRHG